MTDATMDEATNTALLLEQHIHEKLMRALVEITLTKHQAKVVADTLDFGATIEYAATEFRRMLIHSVVYDHNFEANLRQMVMTLVQEEVAKLVRSRQDLDEVMKSAIVRNSVLMPKDYNNALHKVAETVQTRIRAPKSSG